MRVVNAGEMQEILKLAAEEYGLTEDMIQENFALRATDWILKTYLEEQAYGEIVVLVGKGRNGVDGMTMARHLKAAGYSVRCFLLFLANEVCPSLDRASRLAHAFGVKITELRSVEQVSAYFRETQESFFVIDAIYGTGLRHPMPALVSEVISLVNELASVIVSVDMPSGVMADSGKIEGPAIKATTTLACALPKVGHYISPGATLKGQLHIISAGLPPKVLEGGEMRLLRPDFAVSDLAEREAYAHKKSFGHGLFVGGSKGFMGANVLAANGAVRSGLGQVSICTWEQDYEELVSYSIPEYILGVIPEKPEELQRVLRTLNRYHSIVIGPGLGSGKKAYEITLKVLTHYSGPMVLDADAINVLSFDRDKEYLRSRTGTTLLTPHVGEFAHFMGVKKEEILERPIYWLKKAVEETNCAILVKGPCTLIGFSSGEMVIHDFPNDGMATGGSGAVLAGVLGGVIAQVFADKNLVFLKERPQDRLKDKIKDLHFLKAVGLGVSIHSLAGQEAAKRWGKRSMTASSIVESLPQAFERLEGPIGGPSAR